MQILDAVPDDVPEAINPRDFRRRLATLADTLELDFAILGRQNVIALSDFGIVWWDEDCDFGLARSDWRGSCGMD